jgi:hypothetical protein
VRCLASCLGLIFLRAPPLVLPGSNSIISAVVLHPWAGLDFSTYFGFPSISLVFLSRGSAELLARWLFPRQGFASPDWFSFCATAIFPAPVYPAFASVSRDLAALQSLREAIAPEQAAVTGSPFGALLFFTLGSLLPDFSPCRLNFSFSSKSNWVLITCSKISSFCIWIPAWLQHSSFLFGWINVGLFLLVHSPVWFSTSSMLKCLAAGLVHG